MKIHLENGFTLIELMITVAIVAILAAIAYPSYTQSVLRSHRTDARNALMQDAQMLEKCFTQNGNFTGCGAFPHSSDNLFYSITITDTTAAPTTYTLTATATGTQTADSNCLAFTLDNTGIKTPDPKTDTNHCWNK